MIQPHIELFNLTVNQLDQICWKFMMDSDEIIELNKYNNNILETTKISYNQINNFLNKLLYHYDFVNRIYNEAILTNDINNNKIKILQTCMDELENKKSLSNVFMGKVFEQYMIFGKYLIVEDENTFYNSSCFCDCPFKKIGLCDHETYICRKYIILNVISGKKFTINATDIHTIKKHHFYSEAISHIINFFEINPSKNYSDVEIVHNKFWNMKIIEPINNNTTFNKFIENSKRYDSHDLIETPYITQIIKDNIICYNNNHLYICCQNVNSDNVTSFLGIKLNEINIDGCYVKYDLCETITLTENELINENTKK